MDKNVGNDEHKVNQATYERIAQIYTDKHFESEFLDDQLEKFVEHLRPSGTVLDLGCGPGQFSKKLLEKGFTVTAVDFSEEMLSIARERIEDQSNIEFVQANILEYPFEEKRYDGVWANAVLLHFSDEELVSTLKSIKNTLNDNGILHVSFIEGDGKRRFERVSRGIQDTRYFYDRQKEEIEKLLTQIGFEILDSTLHPGPQVNFFSILARKS